MYVWAARCSRARSPERWDALLSCFVRFATRDSSKVFLYLSTRPRSERPTPTRIPMIRARKTAASDATWYRRSNISELHGSLAQRVQPVQRVPRQRAPQADEERGADGQLRLGARRRR